MILFYMSNFNSHKLFLPEEFSLKVIWIKLKVLGTFSIFVCQVDADGVNLHPLWLTHIPLI